LNYNIEAGVDFLNIGFNIINVFVYKINSDWSWKKLGIDIVVECTGLFTDRENAKKHLKAGAKKVLISAPAKNPDITIVPGVNHKKLKKQHKIISMASCTTNCLAPIAKVLNDKFKIKKGFMTTIHAYTSSQKILDSPHKKLRRGRAGALNLVPTTTGATKAVIEVLPGLKNKLDGLAIRAPVPTGSIVDFVVELQRKASIKEINQEFKKQADGKLKGILQYTEDEIVSSDIIKNTHSSIFDAQSTQIIGQGNKGSFVKVLSWYDNEYGYSCRLIDVIKMLK
jgi:glyceraldehyde-3-phosphate dehydrogenase type I